jgi:hypothetical protein
VYGPKVRALRRAALRDESGLLAEFEKLIEAAGVRIDESLQELDILLGQTTAQFRILLAAHADEGALARVVAARSDELATMFGTSSECLLSELYGGPSVAWAQSGRSFLASGFFAEAAFALGQAARLAEAGPGVSRQLCFAEGMSAYLEGRYTEAAAQLDQWCGLVSSPPSPDDLVLLRQAASALSHVAGLAGSGSPEAVAAAGCLERLRALDRASQPASENGSNRRVAARD